MCFAPALDPRPLAETRDPSSRLAGNCRDFSVLLTAFLRHRGVPARARCGFGRYFTPGQFEDHEAYQADARWHVPVSIRSYTLAGVQPVELAGI